MYSLKLGAEVIQMSVVKGVVYRVCKYSINPPEQTLRLEVRSWGMMSAGEPQLKTINTN